MRPSGPSAGINPQVCNSCGNIGSVMGRMMAQRSRRERKFEFPCAVRMCDRGDIAAVYKAGGIHHDLIPSDVSNFTKLELVCPLLEDKQVIIAGTSACLGIYQAIANFVYSLPNCHTAID